MQGQKDIKRKIKTVLNIRKVTKAMEAISRIRLQKASKAAVGARTFFDDMSSFVLGLINTLEKEKAAKIEFLSEKKPKRSLFIVVSSDRGLCGYFNSRIINSVSDTIHQENIRGKKACVLGVGKKASDALARRGFDVVGSMAAPNIESHLLHGGEILSVAVDMFKEKKIDEAYIFYNHFASTGKQEVSALKLFPISVKQDEESAHIPLRPQPLFGDGLPGGFRTPDYLYEPAAEELLPHLIFMYLKTIVYQTLLESSASEHAARMVAMKQATTNADDMLTRLTVAFNKARQSGITRELIEVVSSAEALR